MKRFLSSALVLGVFSMPVLVLSGCGDESKIEDKKTIKTPEGSATTTTTVKENTSGSNPPAPPK